MYTLKSFFSTKTPRGRAVRTFLQVFAGFTFLLNAIVALPQFKDFMMTIGLSGQIVTVSLFVAGLSRLQFMMEENYRKLKEWFNGDES